MDWKKVLFGSIDHEDTTKDGRGKWSLSIRGGLIPSLIFWVFVIWLLVRWLT